METWPSTLPQYPLVEGYSRTPQDSVLKFQTETGRAKERNRATAMPDSITERYVLEPSQRDTLDTFYKVTTKRGTVTFTKIEPETGLVKEYKFDGPPEINRVGTLYTATCKLELLP